MAKKDFGPLAAQILELIGGKDNIAIVLVEK